MPATDGTAPVPSGQTFQLYHLNYRTSENEKSFKNVLFNERAGSYLIMRRDFVEVLNSCE